MCQNIGGLRDESVVRFRNKRESKDGGAVCWFEMRCVRKLGENAEPPEGLNKKKKSFKISNCDNSYIEQP